MPAISSTPSSRALFAASLVLALTVIAPPLLDAQEAEEATVAPPVTIESIRVEPTSPGNETLCRLFVELANAGESTASQFGFTVEVSGQELPVYGNQLFMLPVAAGASEELQLYNFWSAETGRPAPADGKLTVTVTLREAVWMTIGMEEDVEVWTPGDAVPGLPVSATATVDLAAADG